MDLSSLSTLVTMVFSKLKITRGLKCLPETGPMSIIFPQDCYLHWHYLHYE